MGFAPRVDSLDVRACSLDLRDIRAVGMEGEAGGAGWRKVQCLGTWRCVADKMWNINNGPAIAI